MVESGQVALDGATLAHRRPPVPGVVVVVVEDDSDPLWGSDAEAVVAVGEPEELVPLPDVPVGAGSVTAAVTPPLVVVVDAVGPVAEGDSCGLAAGSSSAGPADPPVAGAACTAGSSA